MCGICGIVGSGAERQAATVRAMARALAHRGPDAEGIHLTEGVALANRRLKIIDLETGDQPLSNEDGSLWITFNGEIYNYRELRRELEMAGHRFRTATDTEVIVHLFEEYGERCVDRLRGMFAFAIWDARRRTLFAARDRFGQKPFFYRILGERFLFASEIKGLLAHPAVGVEPEPAAIDYFLTFRFVPSPLTMFRGISKLPAGHWLRWTDGELTVRRYWSLDFRQRERRGNAAWVSELRDRLDDAVLSHLVADVRVGALLSGGLDSSLVAALMARAQGEPVPTFCIGSEDASFDERSFARLVADHCGTDHHERVARPSHLDDMTFLVGLLDEPSDPIAACFLEASRFASEHVKVVIGGDGGDELFAGFDRYAAFHWVGWYNRLPRRLREGVIRPSVDRLRHSFRYKSVQEKLRWLVRVGSESGALRYTRMNSYFRFGEEERNLLYGPALREALRHHRSEEAIIRPFEEAPAEDTLHRMIHADMVTRLPEHTLMLADRLSMAHGLELRAPLLDHHLAEFCARMPARLKIRFGRTKQIMRLVARDHLPRGIVRRPKQGFQLPVAQWLDGTALRTIRSTLLSSNLVRQGWIRPDAVERLLDEHAASRADHHVRIWLLWSLDAWYRLYLESGAVEREAWLAERRLGRQPVG